MQALRPVIVVLAAGLGKRFRGSSHKLAQQLGTTTVLGATLDHALATQLPVVVVTTEPLADLARRHVAARDIVLLPTADSDTAEPLGVGYSIAAGVAARPNAAGWLVMPGDMPQVTPETMSRVALLLAEHPVAYAQHAGRRSHPVGFGAELYSELVMLTGDEGARRLISRYPACAVDTDDEGVLIDIDTPTDLEMARQRRTQAPVHRQHG